MGSNGAFVGVCGKRWGEGCAVGGSEGSVGFWSWNGKKCVNGKGSDYSFAWNEGDIIGVEVSN